ncbi:MAG: Fe-S cluster assembly protein SufD [Gloeomargaritaceae cyanobacterium C42_A2020_066]|nr:Fe-S cluster assembly protein SufD [Gloeomargaritaceae cyanobacterium C42_A2020_066]
MSLSLSPAVTFAIGDLLEGRPAVADAALQAWRNQALGWALEMGLPGASQEAWRLTPLKTLLTTPFRPAGRGDAVDQAPDLAVPELPLRLVFVNGVFDAAQSQVEPWPAGVTLTVGESLPPTAWDYLGKVASLEQDVFVALNQACTPGVVCLEVAAGRRIQQPIHLVFIGQSPSQPSFNFPRWLVILEDQAELTLVETYHSTGPAGCSAVGEVVLGAHARLNHTYLQQEGPQACHLAHTAVHQATGSHYDLLAITTGASFARHTPTLRQQGPETMTHLSGLVLLQGQQVADTHSFLGLSHPQGYSRQLHKAILGGSAQAIFSGRVRVAAQAQQTNAGQLNRTLLLSPQARVDSQPQLEIEADDVKCTHGATVSDLDPAEVFYLQSRGIDPAAGRTLLLTGFAGEILQHPSFPSLKARVQAALNDLSRPAAPPDATP